MFERKENLKRLKAVRVDSPDGEKHFVLQELPVFDPFESSKDSETELKKTTKKDASKLLLITHV